jgi:hypothetical protein
VKLAIKLPFDHPHPKRDGTDVPNVPCGLGRSLGKQLARFANIESERLRVLGKPSGLKRYARLQTKTRLKRTWLRRKSPRRIARETPAEVEHKRLIRQAGVCAAAKYAGVGRCSGGFEVAHLGRSGGMGRKHGDWTETTLLCRRHHTDLDQRRGPLGSMPAEEREAWLSREIYLARAFVAGLLAEAA